MASTTTTTIAPLVGFENVTKGKVENNEWTGVGIFDTLMYAANKNIEIQFNKGRIVGKEYAEAYTNVMNTIIAQAIQYYLHKDSQDEQAALTYAQRVNIDKETALIGLDNVVKDVEAGRTSTDATVVDKFKVYTPKYNRTST
jgi:hypothetical protein